MAAHGEMTMSLDTFGLKEIFQYRIVDAQGSTAHVVEGGTMSLRGICLDLEQARNRLVVMVWHPSPCM